MKFTVEPKPDLKLHGVKMNCDDQDNDDKYLKSIGLPGKHTCSYFVGGPGSGKTSLLYSFLHSSKPKFYRRYFDTINIWSPSLHTSSKAWKVQPESIKTEFNESEIEEVLSDLDNTEKNLLLFDDMISQINKSGKGVLRTLFFNRRHRGITLFLTSQRYNLLDLSLRTNLSHLFLWNTSKAELLLIYEEKINGIDKETWLEMCEWVFQEPHTFLYLQLQPTLKFHKNLEPIKIMNTE